MDLVLEVGCRRFARHVYAVTVNVILPAVVDATQAGFLVTAQKQRCPPEGAEFIDDPDPSLAIAENHQSFTQKLNSNRWAVRLWQLRRECRRNPIAPHHLSQGGAGPGLGYEFVLFPGHAHFSYSMNQFVRLLPPEKQLAVLSFQIIGQIEPRPFTTGEEINSFRFFRTTHLPRDGCIDHQLRLSDRLTFGLVNSGDGIHSVGFRLRQYVELLSGVATSRARPFDFEKVVDVYVLVHHDDLVQIEERGKRG